MYQVLTQDDKEQKRLAQLQRKKDAKELLDEEEKTTSGKSKQKVAAPKLTRAQIEYQKQKEEQLRQAAEKEKEKEAEMSNDFVGENPNQAMADLIANEGK